MFFAFLGCFILYNKFLKERSTALVYSILSCSCFLFLITELFSIGNHLSGVSIWCSWILAGMLLWVGVIHTILKLKIDERKCVRSRVLKFLKKNRLWVAFAFVAVTFACLTVPYNWDSMTYHLPRIIQWAQNHSTFHFATNDTRQVSSPQFVDFCNLQIFLMTGNDRLFNIPQCGAYLFNGLLIYQISKSLKIGERWSVLGSILFYSTPIAFLEGFTTQNDNVAALFALTTVYLLLPYLDLKTKIAINTQTIIRTIMISISLGLGYITKPSVCIGLLFWGLFLLVVCICRRDNVKNILCHMGISIIPVVLIILPEMIKNLYTFDKILPSNVGARQLIGTHGKRLILMNLYKTFTFNLPTQLIFNSEGFIYNLGNKLASILNVDINAIEIAEDGKAYSVIAAPHFGCDVAPNPIIAWLFVICIILLAIYRKKNTRWDFGAMYFGVSAVGFVVFCAVLRWEPFISRYMISYFAIMIPGMLYLISKVFPERKEKISDMNIIVDGRYVWGGIFTLCMLELFSLFLYQGKLVYEQHNNEFGEKFGYFWEHSSAYFDCDEIAKNVNELDINSLGIVVEHGCYEYGLYKMLDEEIEFRRIMIDNETNKYERRDFIPDGILVYEPDIDIGGNEILYNGTHYLLFSAGDKWSIYTQ